MPALPFRRYQSSILPLDREIPDTRIKECVPLEYDVVRMLGNMCMRLGVCRAACA